MSAYELACMNYSVRLAEVCSSQPSKSVCRCITCIWPGRGGVYGEVCAAARRKVGKKACDIRKKHASPPQL